MNRVLALKAAEPDETGTRWAIARTPDRVYVAVQWPDAREAIQIRREHLGVIRTRQIRRAPAGLNWQPLGPRSTD